MHPVPPLLTYAQLVLWCCASRNAALPESRLLAKQISPLLRTRAQQILRGRAFFSINYAPLRRGASGGTLWAEFSLCSFPCSLLLSLSLSLFLPFNFSSTLITISISHTMLFAPLALALTGVWSVRGQGTSVSKVRPSRTLILPYAEAETIDPSPSQSRRWLLSGILHLQGCRRNRSSWRQISELLDALRDVAHTVTGRLLQCQSNPQHLLQSGHQGE